MSEARSTVALALALAVLAAALATCSRARAEAPGEPAAAPVPTAAAVTVCQAAREQPTRVHWRWRIIDGRKCWFPGRDRRAKALLTWQRVTRVIEHEAREDDPREEEIHPDELVDTFDERWRPH